jgi:hypothetical protein
LSSAGSLDSDFDACGGGGFDEGCPGVEADEVDGGPPRISMSSLQQFVSELVGSRMTSVD